MTWRPALDLASRYGFGMAAPVKKPTKRRYGLGWILLTIALATGAFAALGVLAAHLSH